MWKWSVIDVKLVLGRRKHGRIEWRWSAKYRMKRGDKTRNSLSISRNG